MFNAHDIRRDECQLTGAQARCGYDWWWHSFTAHDAQTGQERPFFIEFFLCNPDLGRDTPVLGQAPDVRAANKRPSYLMVKAGAWGHGADGSAPMQLHRFFGWGAIGVQGNAPFCIEADDCFLSETETRGRVCVSSADAARPELMSDAGEMSWNLKIDKRIAFNVGYGASGPMRRVQLFEMFWHAEGMKALFEGQVVLNGRRYLVDSDTCFGYADKNWGRDFTTPWVWLASSNLKSELSGKHLLNSAFDIGGGRPKVGPIALDRKLLSAFWYEGEPFEFNFSKFWTLAHTKFCCHETDDQILWHVEQRTWADRLVADISCDKRDMLLINYEAPNGTRRHRRLWNGGNGSGTVELYRHDTLVDRMHAANIGCEYGEYDHPGPYGK